MRRLAVILGGVAAALWVSSPASAFAHDKVRDPALHAVAFLSGLGLTAASLLYVRRIAPSPAPAHAPR
ncbi:hypothetical protein GCM10022251_43990 [Phytohabitans flavus]|uniref:Uncharacterized protein n=1 Tax=Phytohabitans flavus TaxID=1076124 RepID=A0A6F8XYJ3_9ACTN|nr:hypothetical protein [Phytohabitans flavus]BCB78883.1 hypothetical protein Pflav_052930 [Phytohabitans flavus]